METIYDDGERKLEKYAISEISSIYQELYSEVFGSYGFQGNYPSEVYIGYIGGKHIGFFSGYVHSPSTWYLQRAGFIKNQQGKTENLQLATLGFELLHKKWKYILTLISNEDTRALKFALIVGFKIIGVRIDTAKNIWVEFIKEGRNNGSAKVSIG